MAMVDNEDTSEAVAIPDPYEQYTDRQLLIMLHHRMDSIEAIINQATTSLMPMLQQLESSPMGRMMGSMFGRR